jgi:hypothetical protein
MRSRFVILSHFLRKAGIHLSGKCSSAPGNKSAVMRPRNRHTRYMAVSAAMIYAASAAAASAPSAQPPFRIQGCTTYLQLAVMQRKLILADFAQLRYVRAERAALIRRVSADPSPPAAPSTTVPPRAGITEPDNDTATLPKPSASSPQPEALSSERNNTRTDGRSTIPYDIQIDLLAYQITVAQSRLKAFDGAYRTCIKKPPGAEPSAKSKDKK